MAIAQDITIASSETTSGAINCNGLVPVAVETPAALTGTSISFTACTTEGGTYVPIHKEDGSAYAITVSASAARLTALDPKYMRGVRYLKLVGSSQAADRSLKVLLTPNA